MSILDLRNVPWRKRIWILGAGAAFTVWIASRLNSFIAIGLTALYLVLFILTIKKQFL